MEQPLPQHRRPCQCTAAPRTLPKGKHCGYLSLCTTEGSTRSTPSRTLSTLLLLLLSLSSSLLLLGVVVVRTWNLTQMHLIGVGEHLGVGLPASPPPWASTSGRTEAEKCCKPAANYPSSPPSPPCTAETVRTCLCGRLKCPLTPAMN